MQVLNLPQHAGRFNFTAQFPHYREVLYKPDFAGRTRGKPIVFDMDMSAGDFVTLMYLLKVPVETIDLKVKSFFKLKMFENIVYTRQKVGYLSVKKMLESSWFCCL